MLAVLAGTLLIGDAAGQDTGADRPPDAAQPDASPAQSIQPAEGAKAQSPTPEVVKLPADFKFRLSGVAAPTRSLVGVAVGGLLSIMVLMLCLVRGFEQLIRLHHWAFGYFAFALGGLGIYALIAMRLLETPTDLVEMKRGVQGDASLVETIVAFAQRRHELPGDPYQLDRVEVYDGSVNLFLADRLDFIAGSLRSPLEPHRKSLMIDVRGDAIAFHQEIELLGMPFAVTLFVPIEGRVNALRFGEPTARVGTWGVLPHSLVEAAWENLRGEMARALAEVKFLDTFVAERISEGFIHIALRSPGGAGAQ